MHAMKLALEASEPQCTAVTSSSSDKDLPGASSCPAEGYPEEADLVEERGQDQGSDLALDLDLAEVTVEWACWLQFWF